MATTRSGRRVAGKPPEDQTKNSSKLVEALKNIYQKRKQKENSVIGENVPEQTKTTLDDKRSFEELPFVEVQPLPEVARGVPDTTKSLKLNVDSVVESLKLKDDNVTKSSKPKVVKDEVSKMVVEPGYKNRAPLQLDERAKDLLQEALKNPISITTEDLLNVSEPVRQELKKLLIKKRLEKKSVTLATEGKPAEKGDTSEQRDVKTISVEKLPEATYEVLAKDTNGMSKGSVIVSDPVMQYLNALAPGEKPKTVIVAAESHALRTVYPLINGVGEVESLLDPGSQIVSMSKTIAAMLQVTWDPDIVVHMESANKTLEKTLGLAKNVPFLFGTITVYLQVHVIGNAAYKVLLGRPFDIVTESVVKNARNGSQSLTLTDPNSGERCVMETHEKGKVPTILQRSYKSDFHLPSMN